MQVMHSHARSHTHVAQHAFAAVIATEVSIAGAGPCALLAPISRALLVAEVLAADLRFSSCVRWARVAVVAEEAGLALTALVAVEAGKARAPV